MTPLRFRLDETLAIQAARLDASRYNMRILSFGLALALLTSAVFIFIGGVNTPERIVFQVLMTMGGALVLGGATVFLLRAIFLPMKVRKNLRQNKPLAEEMQLSWTEDEFCYAAGKSRTEMPFRSLHGVRSSGEVLLLYVSDTLYLLVPVAAFGESGLHEAFIRRLAEAGVRRL
jgi:hypothetical protein